MRTSLHWILTAAGAAFLLGSLAAPVRADILYVSNYGFNTIQKFTSDGVGTVFADAGDGLNSPGRLAFDSVGNLYVANGGSTILKLTPDGVSSVFADASDGLNGAGGLAFDGAGNLFVVTGNDTILKLTPDGLGSVFADASDGVNGLTSLAFDRAGNLYGTSYYGKMIEKFTPDGVGSVFADASGGLIVPISLAFDTAGNLFVENGFAEIVKFTSSGARSYFAGFGIDNHPVGIAFDSVGNLFVANSGSNSIGKFTPDGGDSWFAHGIWNGLYNPVDLAFTNDAGVPLLQPGGRLIPEPSTLALLGLGLPALLCLSRSRRRAG